MWRVFSASATGKRNLEHGAPGQDANHVLVSGDVLVAIVCDGAGSVPEGRTGSQFTAQHLAETLSAALRSPQREPLDQSIRGAIDAVRTQLETLASSRESALQDFSCTLIGCVATAGGGFFFHVGDGFGIWQDAAGARVVSQPENGEYADETYFVTDENWMDHLRFTPIPTTGSGCMIGLMSDGTAPFAVNRERSGFFRPFIEPIAAFLRAATAPDGSAALRNLLESPRACEISPDDKTLVLAFTV